MAPRRLIHTHRPVTRRFRMWGNVYGLREAEIILQRLRSRGSAEFDGNWFKIESPSKKDTTVTGAKIQ
jgi:hypothetical protein